MEGEERRRDRIQRGSRGKERRYREEEGTKDKRDKRLEKRTE